MLTYGYMYDSFTYCNEINRLLPGEYIKFSQEGFEVSKYHSFTFSSSSYLKKNEMIRLVNEKFKKALKLEIDKDNEYNYYHLMDLSGGLDSRMVNIVGKQFSEKRTLNITYSQNNYLDEIIAKKISTELNNDFIFYSLNNASFIYDLKSTVRDNFGLSYYAGITGGKKILGYINLEKFGLEHTGQLGDVILGTYIKKRNEKNTISGLYSPKNVRLIDQSHLNKYSSQEEYMIYVRGFLGTLSSHLIRQKYTEVASPFLDVDFMQFCFSIPSEYRINHALYKTWIRKYYRLAMKYKWEKTNTKIYRINTLENLVILGKKILKRILLTIRLAKTNSMNPFEVWYNSNTEISSYINDFFKDNINFALIPENMRKNITEVFNTSNVITKLQVLTALESIRMYFE